MSKPNVPFVEILVRCGNDVQVVCDCANESDFENTLTVSTIVVALAAAVAQAKRERLRK